MEREIDFTTDDPNILEAMRYMINRISTLEHENKRLEEALEFQANIDGYATQEWRRCFDEVVKERNELQEAKEKAEKCLEAIAWELQQTAIHEQTKEVAFNKIAEHYNRFIEV